MDKDDLRAAVDILWDSLSNCCEMEGVDKLAWKEEHFKRMMTGISYCVDSKLAYNPASKPEGKSDELPLS